FAFTRKQIDKLPFKKVKPKIRQRYFDYLVLQYQEKIYLRKRAENDIWKNLFDFPVIESEKFMSLSAIEKTKEWKSIFSNCTFDICSVSETYPHLLSHQHLNARFWSIRLLKKYPFKGSGNLILADAKTINNFPLPRLIERFLEA